MYIAVELIGHAGGNLLKVETLSMDVPLETLFLIDIKLCVRFVTDRLRKFRMWYSPETLTTTTCHTQYKHTELTLHVG